MTEYHVQIPDESLVILDVKPDGKPAVIVVNSSLASFEPKVVFNYHLSIIIDFVGLVENGMPSLAEREVVDPFGDSLDHEITGDLAKPNALFLARVTWNRTRQLLYRVHDPASVHDYLQGIIAAKAHPREFDYRLDPDPRWEVSSWYLQAVSSS